MHTLAQIAQDNVSGLLDFEKMKPGTIDEMPQTYNLSFRKVDFSYSERSRLALKNVSFDVVENGVTALVGQNGSGKTTCLELLMRFRDPSRGTIWIGGTDIRDFSPNILSSIFAPVFQEPRLFHDTVEANIKLGRPDASREDVIEAAKAAAIHDTIVSRQGGYDAMVTPFGRNFSGGERQRIAIARAILKNSPIVLLDEATAALDPENEDLIQKGISSLVRNKTIIIVAHRLSTIVNADCIIVMNGGCVVAKGKHTDLLETSEYYQTLWERFNSVIDPKST